MSEIASGFVTLIPSFKGAKGGIQKELDGIAGTAGVSAGNKAGKGFGGGVKSGFGKMGSALGTVFKTGALAAGGAGVALLGTALTKGFSRLNAIDQAKAKLSGLGNSAATVDKIMGNALASVKGTAFGLDEAATTAAGAVAAGIKPGKELEGVLKTVADTATIAGASMADTGAIFGSVAARGKLQGDDLMQLQSRGVPVLAFLAKHYKTTAAEASKMVSKGKVDFKNFNAAMQENLGGAALKSGETFKGAFANMKASLGRIGANLLSGIFPQVKSGIGGITKILSSLEPVATKVGKAIGDGLAKVGPVVKQIAEGFTVFKEALSGGEVTTQGWLGKVGDIAYGLRDAFIAALPTIKQLVSNVVGFAQVAIPAVKQFVTGTLVPLFGQVASFITTRVVPAVMGIVTAIRGWVSTAGPIVAAFVTGMIARIQPMMPQIKAIFTTIGQIITGVMGLVSAVISRVTAIVGGIWSRWGTSIMNFTGAVFGSIITVIGGALKIVSGVIKLFTAIFKGDWSGAWAAIKQIVSGAWAVIKGIVSTSLTVLKGVISGAGGLLKAAMSAVWGKVKEAVSSGITAAVNLVKGLPGKIVSALGDLGGLLKGAGERLIQGLADGITSRIKAVTDAVGAVAGKIKGFFPGSPVKEGPLTSWNNGGAGRRLGNMLAEGLVASQRTVAASSRSLAGSVAAPESLALAGVASGRAGAKINVYTNNPLEAAHAVERRWDAAAMSGALR